jgi:hypothetical protein
MNQGVTLTDGKGTNVEVRELSLHQVRRFALIATDFGSLRHYSSLVGRCLPVRRHALLRMGCRHVGQVGPSAGREVGKLAFSGDQVE